MNPISADILGSSLKEFGFDFYAGVPCSFLKDLINYAINNCTYIGAANEGDAVAICVGANLAGKKSVVLMQNSGLTNATSPLTSLTHTFNVPILGFISIRGGEEGIKDEPQHELMGQITTRFLDLMNIRWAYLSTNPEELVNQIKQADTFIKNGTSFFFVVKKGSLSEVKLDPQSPQLRDEKNLKLHYSKTSEEKPSRTEALQTICNAFINTACVLATTGKTGRELFDINDAKNHLYMVGSMGCISSLGLGLALAQDKKLVVAIDGDGALLMRAGSMATNAYYKPDNLLHILLDNQSHDSTGGQLTTSTNVDFPLVAHAFSYPIVTKCSTLDELKDTLEQWKQNPKLTFIYLKIRSGSPKSLPRPDVKPSQVRERFMQFIQQ
jgi:phosphonopyruvate decarboxylase